MASEATTQGQQAVAHRVLRASGEVQAVAPVVAQALEQAGWRVRWSEPEARATCTVGSRALYLLFGALTPYHRIELAIEHPAGEPVLVSLERHGDGRIGGLLGMRRARQEFGNVVAHVEAALGRQGLLAAQPPASPTARPE